MTTVLRVNGSTKGVLRFLESTSWKPVATYVRGQPVRPSSSRISRVSGFNVRVSRAGRLSLQAQIRGVQGFLIREDFELQRLAKAGLRGVMDFGVASSEDAAVSFYGFPHRLLSLLAAYSLDLEVSYYGVEP